MPHGGKRVWVSQAVGRQLPFVVDFLGLRRNVVVLSLAIFCVGLGEELWARFLPKYLEALGASILAIGAFGTFHARPRGDAGKPGRRCALEAGSPGPFLRRGWYLSPRGGADVDRSTRRDRSRCVKTEGLRTRLPPIARYFQ